jgi:hypothetical protein
VADSCVKLWPSVAALDRISSRRDSCARHIELTKADMRDRQLWITNRLMRVIRRLGYRLTDFAYLAVASKATRAGNLTFPCEPDD